MATFYVSHRGNLAIQEECWTLSLGEATQLNRANLLDTRKGTYWEASFLKPYRRAKRAKAASLRLYTAGFSTGELSNVLFNAGIFATERSAY